MAYSSRDNRPSTGDRSSSPGLPPPPPPPHTTAIPARLSLDQHRDGDGGSIHSGPYDLSSVLSIVRGLDSHDENTSGGSSHSYEMVSPQPRDEEEERSGYFGTTTGSRDSVERQRLAVVNHGHYSRDGSQLEDAGVDRSWEDVSAANRDAAADNTRRENSSAQLYDDHYHHHHHHHHHHHDDDDSVHPALRAQNDHDSGDFFKDFDGVHYSPDPGQSQFDHHRNHADQRRQSRVTLNNITPSESSRDSGLVYYPAPVPAVLNLPPLMAKDTKARNRLSKVQKRASQQVLSDATAEAGISNNRRSQVVAPQHDAWTAAAATTSGNADQHHHHRLSNLPPALRASVFFDSAQPAAPQIMAGESSAVETLDSILNASANAPPAAFTDHPITGTDATQLAPPRRNEYRNSVAMTVTLHPGESPPASEAGGDNNNNRDLRNSRSFERTAPAVPVESALPTTLLAELEQRKQQLKSRNRTAASAFPTGIRSTLLELDAVAQVQATSRRQKRTTLAWEDPNEEAADDEDVPLGVLYNARGGPQGRAMAGRDDDVPLGLLMQKQIEDSEPLAKRRERLRGPQPPAATPAAPPKIPPLMDDEEEEEEESLAARMKRLKEEKEHGRASIGSSTKRISTFGDGGLDLNFEAPTASAAPPQEEETLAQRRKRLQAEEERRRLAEEAKAVQHEVRKRHSIATQQQMQMQMLGAGLMGRSTPMLVPQRPMSGMPLGQRPMSGMGYQPRQQSGLIHQAGIPHQLRPQMSMGAMPRGGGLVNGGGMGGGAMAQNQMAMTPQEMAMNNKQREMVERWRASVM
jgi:hypothetical protein